MREKKSLPYLLLTPTLAILFFFAAFPLIYGIYVSLFKYDLGAPRELMKFIGLNNYKDLFTDPYFWKSLWITFLYVVTALILEFSIGLLLALAVTRSQDRRLEAIMAAIRPFLFLPMIVTPVVVGLMWRQLFNFELGLVNYFFSLVGIPPQTWLTNKALVLPVIIFTDVWEWTPFMFLIFLSGLSSIPPDPIESAMVDGAGHLRILFMIKLPLMIPIIQVVLLIRGIDLIKFLDIIYVLTGGGPGNATEVLSLFAYRKAFLSSQLGYGSAVAVIITLLVTIIGINIVNRMYKEMK